MVQVHRGACLRGVSKIAIGQVDSRITSSTQMVGQGLSSLPGFGAEIRTDMDAWLKTYVAMLMLSLAPAMRATGRHNTALSQSLYLDVCILRSEASIWQKSPALPGWDSVELYLSLIKPDEGRKGGYKEVHVYETLVRHGIGKKVALVGHCPFIPKLHQEDGNLRDTNLQ